MESDPPDDVECAGLMATASSSNGSQPCQGPKEDQNRLATDIMRIEKQMSNQCFEMAVKVHAEKNRRSCSELEAEGGLPDLVSQLEEAKTMHFCVTTANHRLQISNILAEKAFKDDDPEDRQRQRCLVLHEDIRRIQKETQDLEERIIEIRKQKLELKRLTLEKMKEAEDLMKEADPIPKETELRLQKSLSNLEKYNKMVAVTQNVLRGILLACKVNWMDDPNVCDILLSLDKAPASE